VYKNRQAKNIKLCKNSKIKLRLTHLSPVIPLFFKVKKYTPNIKQHNSKS